MSQIKIPSGNDFVLELICMRQVDTETKDAFDISTCTNVSLNLYDETREDYVQLNSWALADGTTNVIRANVEGTALQPKTKYGLVITGVDENGENFKTRIRGRNFIYVVGSISDVSANDFITNPLTIQVTMNIQGELKPVVFDDLATVEVVDEKIAAAIESIDFSDYATKNELNQTNEALSAESRTRSSVDQTLQSAVEAVGTNLSSNYYTKTQVDDIVSSITGTGGDVTKEYVDNAVSDCLDDAKSYTDDAISKSNLSYEKQYLTFEAITQGNITIITQGETPEFKTISYSTDNGSTWNDITTSTTEQTLATLNIGDKLLVKGLNNSYAVDNDNYTKFGGTAQVKLYGNIMSLIYGDNFIGQTSFQSESSNNFARLFEGNTKITDAENLILPVTTLTNNCYGGMFSDCSSLTTAPELPATTLIDYCYNGMFQNCTSLTTAPKLPAIALGFSCYSYMFSGCTSLTTAPKLPAPILVSDCYSYMFQDCSSLTPAPELPATILAPHCYEGMFISCRSLTTAPELPATTLEEGCYNKIFYGCDELKYIKALFTTEPGGNYTWAWVYGVSPTGTFIKSDDAEWTPTVDEGVPSGWNVYTESEYNYMHKYELQNYATQTFVNEAVSGLATEAYVDAKVPVPYEEQYLTFEFTTNGTLEIYCGDESSAKTIQYSIDGGNNWNSLTTSTTSQSFGNFNKGDKILFKGTNNSYSNGDNKSNIFNGTASFNVYGNIMSLIYGDNFIGQTTLSESDTFRQLFKSSKIKSAENLILPATSLTNACYLNMFQGSTIIKCPKLPAMSLVTDCYGGMFENCKSLTIAPELPATNLAGNCYNNMFGNCSNLEEAPILHAKTVDKGLAYGWIFQNCSKIKVVRCYAEVVSGYDPFNAWLGYGSGIGCEIITSDNPAPELLSNIPSGSADKVYTKTQYEQPYLYNSIGGGISSSTPSGSSYTVDLAQTNYNKSHILSDLAESFTINLTNSAGSHYGSATVLFNTTSGFSGLQVNTPSGTTLSWIGDDATNIEANKSYYMYIEQMNTNIVASYAETTTQA